MRTRRLILVLVLLLVGLALRIWATAQPVSWLWSLDALRDVPLALRITGLVLFAVAVLPPVGAGAMRAIQAASTHRRRGLTFALIAFGLLLVTLPTTHALHGDARVYLSSLDKGLWTAGAAHREPLPLFLVSSVHRIFVEPLGGPPSVTFRIWELLAGLLFFGLTLGLSARLSDTMRGRTLICAAVIGGGTWPLFAGHAELYSFALVAIAAFVFTGLRWIDGRGRLLWVGVTYALAGLCHAMLALTGPGLLLLVLEQWRRGERRAALATLALVAVLVPVSLLALDYPFADLKRELSRGDALLPPLGTVGGRTAYDMFSWVHGVDFLNVALLLSPILLLSLPLIRISRRGNRGEALKLSFLGASALGPLLFVFAANPALGMVRDWDLYSLAILLTTLAVAASAVRQVEPRERAPSEGDTGHAARADGRADALVGMLLLTGLLHGASWLLANHEVTYAESRLRRIVSNPALFGPVSRGEVWRYLAWAAVRSGDPSAAAHGYLAAIRADPEETMPYRQLASLTLRGASARGRSPAEGLSAYHEALAAGPFGRPEAHLGGVIAAVEAGEEALAVAEAQAMLSAAPDVPEYQAIWGDLARRAGEVEEAELWYRRALTSDEVQVRALLGLACLAGMRGDRDTLVSLSRRVSSARPFSTQGQQFARLVEEPGALSPQRCRGMFFYR